MGLGNLFLETFFKETFKQTFDYFKELYKENAKAKHVNYKTTLETHFGEVVNWCSNIEFIGLNSPKSIVNETIPLNFNLGLRESNNSENTELTEELLLTSNYNYVLAGDPGAGKTTTLKRITENFLFSNIECKYKFPVLIRLKEIERGTLFKKIADVLGIEYTAETKRIEGEVVIEYRTGGQLLENAVPSFLNNKNALIILDGFDEIENKIKKTIKNDIKLISRKSISTKIFLTSRHGEDFYGLEGFTFIELKPLNTKQIEKISESWAINPKLFIQELNSKSYSEITNRPLFLNFLILYFNKNKYLPDESHEIIKEIISLLLDDWNRFQETPRVSIYSGFYNSKKISFLSNLAYSLTYEYKIKCFNHDELVKVYHEIYKKYNLVKDEAEIVAKEIESHTGIIIKLDKNKYEFSHLIIQEYLTADYIIKKPFTTKLFELFKIYPAVLAITTCLSSESGSYFGYLFLNTNFSRSKIYFSNQVEVYLNRLIIEKISFNESEELGLAFTFLFFEYQDNSRIMFLLTELAKQITVIKSIENALKSYSLIKNDLRPDVICYRKNIGLNVDEEIKKPVDVAIPIELKELFGKD